MKLLGLRAKMTNKTPIEIHQAKCRLQLPSSLRRSKLADHGQLAWIRSETVTSNDHAEELRVGRAERAFVTTRRESSVHHSLADATNRIDVQDGVFLWSRIRMGTAGVDDEI